MDQEWKNKTDVKFDKLFELNKKQDIALIELKMISEKNTEILEEHQRRSLASEKRHDVIEKQVMELQHKIGSHLNYIEGVLKGAKSVTKSFAWVLGVVSTIIGIWYTLSKFI